jgi:hypothetical protein
MPQPILSTAPQPPRKHRLPLWARRLLCRLRGHVPGDRDTYSAPNVILVFVDCQRCGRLLDATVRQGQHPARRYGG